MFRRRHSLSLLDFYEKLSAMSYFQVPELAKTVRDAFPDGIARLQGDKEKMHTQFLVPVTFDGLTKWAQVMGCPGKDDQSRKNVLVYRPSVMEDAPAKGERKQISVWVYGFVVNFNLDTFGNWNLSEEHARKATQLLTLDSGGSCFDKLIHAQENNLNLINKFVQKTLKTGDDEMPELRGRIVCQRRVFKKVSGHGRTVERSVLSEDDDPTNLAKVVADHWRVVKKVVFERRLVSGAVKPVEPAMFSKGDFVGVRANVDVVTYRPEPKVLKTTLQLSFTRVVQICPANMAPSILHFSPKSTAQQQVTILDDEGNVVHAF